MKKNHFISFKQSIDSYVLPELFTFPFFYEPHPLCVLAARELQEHLQTQKSWNHNFGITGNKETAIGKMFGVLLVQNSKNEIGYLAAFSGKIAGQNHLPGFVPPVYDVLTKDGFFIEGQLEGNQLSEKIKLLESNSEITEYEKHLKSEIDHSTQEIQQQRKRMIEGRKNRKSKRLVAEREFDASDYIKLKEQLSKESIREKNRLKDINNYWGERIQNAEENLKQLTDEISILKIRRKELSAALQKKIFFQYRFLNQKGVTRNLNAIFKETSQLKPPAGAGECAAPKLLQYAFKWRMKPLALAEFWWGASPKSAVRKHLGFYAACHGKCQPILGHMLEGIEMDENPLLINPAEGKTIDIIYEDEFMLVINKPEGLLSVPGKDIKDSVYLRMKQSYPGATGPIIVHRLDMLTSGLMLIALSSEVNKNLQKQFIKRTVKKRYIALLDGILEEDEGVVDLPLRVDLDDRPRQLVCYEHGKPAQTHWEVIERNNGKTRVYFYPITGRTHQLRVHSAHLNGLRIPIIGDDLYGNKANRLHLHAQSIEFKHPVSNEILSFMVEAGF